MLSKRNTFIYLPSTHSLGIITACCFKDINKGGLWEPSGAGGKPKEVIHKQFGKYSKDNQNILWETSQKATENAMPFE